MENDKSYSKQDIDVEDSALFGVILGFLFVAVVYLLDFLGCAFLILHWIFTDFAFFNIATPIVFGVCLAIVVIDSILNLISFIRSKSIGFVVLEVIMLFRYIWFPLIGIILYFIF